MSKVVRSIDVGYGQTKFVKDDDGSRIDTEMFPSICKTATGRLDAIGAKLSTQADVIQVITSDGTRLQVGKEISRNSAARVMVDEFALTPQHEALAMGALSYMGRSRIDLLCLGLPVHVYERLREPVEEKFTKSFKLPPIGPRTAEWECEVKQVMVWPQPLGSLYSYAVGSNTLSEVRKSTNLIIDAGHNSLDWWVSEGLRPQVSRCNSSPASGMGVVLDMLAEKLSSDHFSGKTVDPNVRIEEALRTGHKVKLFQREIDLRAYEEDVNKLVDSCLIAMLNNLGSLMDIDNVIVTGGSAYLYAPAIKRSQPDINLVQLPGSAYGNVKGFQIMGRVVAEKG